MEAIVENLQTTGGIDDEEILDAYESYAEIRKKIVEKKEARGFSSVEAPRWKLTGTVNGKLEQLKQKTRCHHCQRFGHCGGNFHCWPKEHQRAQEHPWLQQAIRPQARVVGRVRRT